MYEGRMSYERFAYKTGRTAVSFIAIAGKTERAYGAVVGFVIGVEFKL